MVGDAAVGRSEAKPGGRGTTGDAEGGGFSVGTARICGIEIAVGIVGTIGGTATGADAEGVGGGASLPFVRIQIPMRRFPERL